MPGVRLASRVVLGEALLTFAPVLGAPLLHAPVLARDGLRALKRPIDGGRTWRGRRLLGDNKTWRGALLMIAGPTLAAILLFQIGPYRDALPDPVAEASPVLVGFLIGLGIVVGEFPNSFLKRQMAIAPGERRTDAKGIALVVLDQGDLVLGVWLCLAPVWVMPLLTGLAVFALISGIHLVINVIGYAIGARTAPI
jgi:CDP-2,3-bis-(O-geranylgeranyl)-sn-glycerol synthase